MAAIAALLPNQTDREFLSAAVTPRPVLWADSWRELQRVVRKHPVGLVVMDLHAETRKDGALRVFRFTQRFPLTPVVAWGDADGRELFRLGKAGAADVVISRHADDAAIVREILELALARGLWPALEPHLRARIDGDGLELLRYASEHIADQIQVPELAAAFDVSISTLERRCERWKLPTPGRLLLWLRVLHGLRWLMEPGRSVESVGQQLGYSSGAAFRRAIKATVGARGGPVRGTEGLERATLMFVSECGTAATAAEVKV
ncbi:MAG TPA: AraC family transcriptional regulator [Longimicrobiales bacterium]|nr:AraC family transcriptional regulator [Longimicrobiales bacterium]